MTAKLRQLDSTVQPPLAARVTSIPPSATVEMSERIRAAQAAGKEILPLASGDPNLPTHPSIIEAAHRAMLDGQTRYGPAAGHLRLSLACNDDVLAEALRRLCRHYGVPYAE